MLKHIFYLVALAYVFLGIFFLDWSFRMVPFSKDAPWYDIIMATTVNTSFVAIGILLYIATFLAVRKKKIASILYDLSFWIGITVLGVATVLLTALVMFANIPSSHIGDVVMYYLLYAPFILVYLNRKRLEQYL